MQQDPESEANKAAELARKGLEAIRNGGVEGVASFKGSRQIASEGLAAAGGDVDKAIERVTRMHVRLAGTSGFVTGLGGLVTLPVAIPASLGATYLLAARLTGSIAHLRGYDLDSDDVRSAILVTMLGSAGAELLKDLGIQIGTKSLAAALKKVPGKVFIEINKAIGFRLITKGGTKGVINMGKAVPLIGGPIGAAFEVVTMRAVAGYADRNFPVTA